MMPRPLDLPEDELLALLREAIAAGVFSESFVQRLRRLLVDGPEAAALGRPLTDTERIQGHLHGLIRARAGDALDQLQEPLPLLQADAPPEHQPGWFPIEGMQGGFKYWWDAASRGPRLMAESWSGAVAGSGQLHEITPAGTRLLGEGFI
jgi:hypothetical protein